MTENITRPGTTHGAMFWRWAWLVVIIVWPLFAHGCHSGDHDDELAACDVESRKR
jgi:hypothetical protein